jgi:cell division protein FtsB
MKFAIILLLIVILFVSIALHANSLVEGNRGRDRRRREMKKQQDKMNSLENEVKELKRLYRR